VLFDFLSAVFLKNSLIIESGIVVFNIISGQLTKKARLEVLLDDGYWPCFSTNKSMSTKAQWGYVGEGFIKEIDFSQVWFRLNEADEGSRDDIIGEWKGDAKVFLEKAIVSCFYTWIMMYPELFCQAEPQIVTLTTDDDDDDKSHVKIEARYIPVPITLEARESVNSKHVRGV